VKRFFCGCAILCLAVSLPSGDARAAYIYWSEYGSGTMNRANLDGTGRKTLASGLIFPGTPALDVPDGYLYFPDCLPGTIQRMKLDGTGRTTLVRGQIEMAD